MKFFEALQIYNKNKEWCVPKKGTPEYLDVMKIMRGNNVPLPDSSASKASTTKASTKASASSATKASTKASIKSNIAQGSSVQSFGKTSSAPKPVKPPKASPERVKELKDKGKALIAKKKEDAVVLLQGAIKRKIAPKPKPKSVSIKSADMKPFTVKPSSSMSKRRKAVQDNLNLSISPYMPKPASPVKKSTTPKLPATIDFTTTKKKRGRPLGSKNKPKLTPSPPKPLPPPPPPPPPDSSSSGMAARGKPKPPAPPPAPVSVSPVSSVSSVAPDPASLSYSKSSVANVAVNQASSTVDRTLKARIAKYFEIRQKLDAIKEKDCLMIMKGGKNKGYIMKGILLLEKKIGTPSQYGTIWASRILIGGNREYPIASKVMKANPDNIQETKLNTTLLNDVILKEYSKHFMIMYKHSNCPIMDANKNQLKDNERLVDYNELMNGDIKTLMLKVFDGAELKIFNIAIQAYIAIAQFQGYTKMFHDDCHHGNFLYQEVDDDGKGYYEYSFNGQTFYVEGSGYNICIFDFGMAKKINANTKSFDFQRVNRSFYGDDYGGWIKKKTAQGHALVFTSFMNNVVKNNASIPASASTFSVILPLLLSMNPFNMFITVKPPTNSKIFNKGSAYIIPSLR
jgi:hypothetical protein